MVDELKVKDNEFVLNRNKTIVIETNHFCNLRCIHCYVPFGNKANASFISLQDADMLFNQLAACGFRNILFTGGEPLAHPQFDKIYENAWDRGLTISIFSNGALLNDRYRDLFLHKKPELIRISLFGGNKQSYEEITGFDLFDQVVDNLLFFKDNKISLSVKMPLLKQNAESIIEARKMLRQKEIENKIEYRIIPRFDGDKDILKYRNSPEQIIEFLYNINNGNYMMSRQLLDNPSKKVRTIQHCIENCQPFIINPDLELHLCFFLREWKLSLKENSLAEAIEYMTGMLKEKCGIDDNPICQKCSRQYFCQYCPGWAKNETGSYNRPIPFLCQLTELYEKKCKCNDHTG